MTESASADGTSLQAFVNFYGKILARPLPGRSGHRNFFDLPDEFVIASAARYPLRTALSMVAGQVVAVQSPARNTRGQFVI